MTSGNVSDEPIAYRDDDALERLAGIADRSCSTTARSTRAPTTRSCAPSRGRAADAAPLARLRPGALAAPARRARPLLACGAELKSTFCLAKGDARLGRPPHRRPAQRRDAALVRRGHRALRARCSPSTPEVVAHDLHPDYLSTSYALERDGVRTSASSTTTPTSPPVLAEHGETGPGGRRDLRRHRLRHRRHGVGRGAAGRRPAGFERAGHLRPVRLPGGDRAVREPWRMACAWLAAAQGRRSPPPLPGRRRRALARGRRAGAHRALGAGDDEHGPPVRRRRRAVRPARRVSYEGQAAVELEAACDRAERGAYPLARRRAACSTRAPPIRAVAADVARRRARRVVAARFHARSPRPPRGPAPSAAGARGLDTVVLSGGVFQNRLLLERTTPLLERAGLRVLVPERLPPNDGGIASARRRSPPRALARRRGDEGEEVVDELARGARPRRASRTTRAAAARARPRSRRADRRRPRTSRRRRTGTRPRGPSGPPGGSRRSSRPSASRRAGRGPKERLVGERVPESGSRRSHVRPPSCGGATGAPPASGSSAAPMRTSSLGRIAVRPDAPVVGRVPAEGHVGVVASSHRAPGRGCRPRGRGAPRGARRTPA